MTSQRAGTWVQQVSGYRAFIPAPLPPVPAVVIEGELARLLSDATLALGRLDGVASILPNPSLFVAMYVRHEAVLSSQIEGTQSTLDDVLAFEAEGEDPARPKDVAEVVNYVAAMMHRRRTRCSKRWVSWKPSCTIARCRRCYMWAYRTRSSKRFIRSSTATAASVAY